MNAITEEEIRLILANLTLRRFVGGAFVVIASFAVTTYLLNRLYPGSEKQGAGAPSSARRASVNQEVPPPLTSQIRGNNLVAQASDLNGSQWHSEELTVEPKAWNLSDPSTTAFLLVETTAGGIHRIETEVRGVTPSSPHTLSVFVKPVGRSSIRFEMRDGRSGKYGIAAFDLPHKKVVAKSGDVIDAGIEAVSNGWFRCWSAMPYATDTAVFNFALLDDKGAASYPGDGRPGLLIWGPFFYRG